MVTRSLWIAFAIALLGFGVLGVVVIPGGMVIGWSLLGFSIGLCARRLPMRVSLSRQVFDLPDPKASAVAVVASVGACFLAACFVLTGMVTVLGGAATTAIVLALASAWTARRLWSRPVLPVKHERPAVASPSDAPVAELSTVDLCAAWKRSYFELLRAVDGPVRERLVRQRQEYLDELERRDGEGFARWLANGARASSDPGRYLTTGS